MTTKHLELNELIERLHNPYYTTKDIIDAVIYLLHRERNHQLFMDTLKEQGGMWESDAKSINNLNEKIEDAEYRNNKEQQEV